MCPDRALAVPLHWEDAAREGNEAPAVTEILVADSSAPLVACPQLFRDAEGFGYTVRVELLGQMLAVLRESGFVSEELAVQASERALKTFSPWTTGQKRRTRSTEIAGEDVRTTWLRGEVGVGRAAEPLAWRCGDVG